METHDFGMLLQKIILDKAETHLHTWNEIINYWPYTYINNPYKEVQNN